jgi:hypothetical protein
MANLIYKDETIKIDNAAGTLTDITAYLTSVTINGSQDLIDDTTMGDEEKSFLFGQAGGTVSLAGVVNTTTFGIFSALAGNRTTATKTLQHTLGSGLVLRGEYLNTSVEFSGSTNSLQNWSYSGTLDGVAIKTSVAL